MPLSVARAKCMEPPVIAGPIVGIYMSLVFQAISNHLVGCGGSVRTHIPSGTGEAYLRIVDKFEKAVGSDASLPKTWREDEAALIGRLQAPINTTEELGTLCEDAVNWEASTIASRVARLMSFSLTLQALQPVEEEDLQACTSLLRAFDFIKHVDSSTNPSTLTEATSRCLMALAISGWSSPFSYMTPARLREMWQAGWIPTFGIKGLIFMFILDLCKGPLLITRTAAAC